MKAASLIAGWICLVSFAPGVYAACSQGAYGPGDGDFVVVVPLPDSHAEGQRYLFRDGRRGSTADPNAPVTCLADAVHIKKNDGATVRWEPMAMTATDVHFSSVGTQMAGRLIARNGEVPGGRPLVVMVHGSEKTSALGSPYAYALAAQGILVFVYDKRGTGDSDGEYTQNFELLATDAAAALAQAKTMARGRYSRAGYFGGSQGGWVAPLAASRSAADFVAIGFGLVASPIEEDREQMISEARALKLDANAMGLIDRLSSSTARLVLSDFKEGYRELAQVKQELQRQPWAQRINGEYSGEMMRLPEQQLRRIGRPLFDNVELIWDYDSIPVLKRLTVPVLWVLAGEDREAPIETTRQALLDLKRSGKALDIYLFPDTDHGMMEFVTNADGSRTMTRITNGYLQLLGDWIHGRTAANYGRARKLDATE
jgi:pimeloyl-ACP methyl ester carboxylesterase